MTITYIITVFIFLLILFIQHKIHEIIEDKQKAILKIRIITLESFIYNLQEGFYYRKINGEKILNDPKWQIDKEKIFDKY